MSRKMEGTVKEILGTCQVLQLCIFCMQFLFTGTRKYFDVETTFFVFRVLAAQWKESLHMM